MAIRRRPSVFIVMSLTAACLAGVVRGEGPLSLDEIASLRDKKQNPGQILRVAKERGRSFAIDDEVRKRLLELGFTPPAIAVLAKVKELEPPKAEVAAEVVVPAENDPETDRIDKIVAQSVARAGVLLTASECGQGRVYGGPGVPAEFAADARQIGTQLTAIFPKAFIAGIDKRAVNVLIVATRSEYSKLLDAVSQAGEANGVRYGNQEGASLQELGAGKPAVYVQGLTTICLEGTPPEKSRRALAHAMGYHALRHVSRGRCGDALAGGFGNVTEVMIHKTPGSTVTGGYSDRELAGDAAWPQLVRQRFTENRIRDIGTTLAGTFAGMQMPQYAEAWSLTTLLCMAPDKFATAIADMRGGAEPTQAVISAYGVDEKAIVAEWQRRAAAP